MVSNTVNGKRISAPAGYNSFDYNKKQVSRSTQVAQGDEKEITTGKTAKVSLGEFLRQIRDFKENRKPLQDVVIIKAEPNKENENER